MVVVKSAMISPVGKQAVKKKPALDQLARLLIDLKGHAKQRKDESSRDSSTLLRS